MKHILETVGSFGRYQKLQFFFMIMLCSLTILHQLGNTFYSASGRHYCKVYDNQTFTVNSPVKNCTIPYTSVGRDIVWDSCTRYDVNISLGVSPDVCFPRSNNTLGCDKGWVYDKTWYENTVVFEYHLVCTNDWMKQLSKSILPLGNIIGVVIFGQISDLFGRRIVIVCNLVLTVAVSIGTAFSPSYIAFITGQFFLGVFPLSACITWYVLISEIVGDEYRPMCVLTTNIMCCFVYMIIGLVAWLCNGEWRYIQLTVALAWAALLPSIFFITESPMWLIQKHKYDRCLKVLKRFAKCNKTTLPDNIFEEEKKLSENQSDIAKGRKYTVVDLLKSPILCIRTLVMCFNWFSTGYIYYGISLNTDIIGDNPYITFILAGLVEIPARLLAWWILGHVGRRPLLCGCQVIGGIALILSIFPDNSILSITLAMISKFCVAASFAIVYLYGVEIYPTVVRNVGMGISSMSSGVGNILSPLSILLDVYWTPLPFVLMGCISVIAGLLVNILPETRNQKLPGTIEEGEMFGKAKYIEEDNPNERTKLLSGN